MYSFYSPVFSTSRGDTAGWAVSAGGASGFIVEFGGYNSTLTGSVTISGSLIQGQVLTASNSLADADGLGTVAYQWFRGGTKIVGATQSTYTLTNVDIGSTLSVVASYIDGGGTQESVTSSATSAIASSRKAGK